MSKHIHTDYRLSETQKQMLRSIQLGIGYKPEQYRTVDSLQAKNLIEFAFKGTFKNSFRLTESGRAWCDKYLK